MLWHLFNEMLAAVQAERKLAVPEARQCNGAV